MEAFTVILFGTIFILFRTPFFWGGRDFDKHTHSEIDQWRWVCMHCSKVKIHSTIITIITHHSSTTKNPQFAMADIVSVRIPSHGKWSSKHWITWTAETPTASHTFPPATWRIHGYCHARRPAATGCPKMPEDFFGWSTWFTSLVSHVLPVHHVQASPCASSVYMKSENHESWASAACHQLTPCQCPPHWLPFATCRWRSEQWAFRFAGFPYKILQRYDLHMWHTAWRILAEL